MKRFIVVFSLLVAACATGPLPDDVIHALNTRWEHKPAKDFFRQYGQPAGTISPDVLGKAYRWVELLPPAAPAESHNYLTHGQSIGFAEPGAVAPGPRFCEMEIQTDRKGLIHGIVMRHDDAGRHSNSLCSEIFQ